MGLNITILVLVNLKAHASGFIISASQLCPTFAALNVYKAPRAHYSPTRSWMTPRKAKHRVS